MKQHVYLIPGMSASSKIFERLHFPTEQYVVHPLEWLMPTHKKESLSNYVFRFSKKIKTQNPVFIGVSFGGVIAQELTKHFPNAKVIIISSIKHPKEMSVFFKLIKTTKAYKMYAPSFVNFLEKKLFHIANRKIKRKLNAYRTYLPIRNKVYAKWAIRSFLNWSPTQSVTLLQLHGDKDVILPIKNIQKPTIISNGTHAMILSNTKTIQKEILTYLA